MMLKPLLGSLVLGVSLWMAGPAVQAQSRHAFPAAVQLAGQKLQLNGQGVRYRAIIPVYEMALYTPKKVTHAEELLDLPGPKSLSFVALRDIPGDQLGLALVRSMRENAEPGQADAITAYMDSLARIFSTEKKIAAGQTFHINYVPGKGTTLFIAGEPKGESVPDPAFIRAVLRSWVGPKPVDRLLKDALLGAPPRQNEPVGGG